MVTFTKNFELTSWHNGEGYYGLRFKKKDRDEYVDSNWDEMRFIFEGTKEINTIEIARQTHMENSIELNAL